MEYTPLQIYKASAGSGKTFTLAVKYISLLAINPTEYQNILAVTFTNKATAEMKQRILSALYGIGNRIESADTYIKAILENIAMMSEQPQYQEEPYHSLIQTINEEVLRQRAKEALSNIIHDYSRFRIETIDSFFQSIVKEIANELELPVNLKVELDETEILGKAVDELIEHLHEGSNDFKSIIEFIESKIQMGYSWKVDEVVKKFGKNIFKENYLIHGEDVRKKVTDKASIDKYRYMIQSYLDKKLEKVTEMGAKFLTAYEQGGCTEKDCTKGIVTFFEKVRDNAIKMPTSSGEGTFSTAIKEHTTNVDKWFKTKAKNRDTLQPYVENVLMPMLTETFDRFNDYKSHYYNVAAITKNLYHLMLLNGISEKVKSINNEKSHFLLSETANFLRNVINNQNIPFIYEKTGSVIKHIMIDEFQDTSVLQWKNFKPLILNSLSTDGSCLIVGDVKQSIYRFRNSDWQILNNIETDPELIEHIRRIPAEYNYRSLKRVVEFNNDLFKNATDILKEYCPSLDIAYGDVEQKPQKQAEAGFVRVENIDYHAIKEAVTPELWEKNTPMDYDEAMLQRVQLSVKELIDNHVNPNDITILIRTNKEVEQIGEYFNQHSDILNVKLVSDDVFRLDASPTINIIIFALRALTAQNDKLHLATLAYYYQTQVMNEQSMADDLSIPFLCDTTKDIDTYLPPKFRKHEREKLQFDTLSEQIEAIYQIFQLHLIANQDAYLFFFHDLVEQYCEDNLTDIDTFLQAWDEKLCEKTIPNGSADGVRIMTMHKAKGLEFHSVIVPSCSWSIKPKDKEIMWCSPQIAPYNEMPLLPISVSNTTANSIFADDLEEEKLKTLVDNINVLYVAFTRAKCNLMILTGNKLKTPKDDTTKEEQKESELRIEDTQSFLVQAMPKSMQQTDDEGVITIFQQGKIEPSGIKKEEDKENVLEQTYAPLHTTFVSYPSVASFRQSYESDLFISAETDNPKVQQRAERIRLISLGNLYHIVFQSVHTIEDIPHAVQLLQSKGCFDSLLDAEEVQHKVTELIKNISKTHPEWFSPAWKVLNERAILSAAHNELITKRPDRVIINDKKAIIIDYKTAQGVVKQHEDGTLVAPAENKNQILGYKDLLLQMSFTDVQAYLWYILDDIVVPV